MNKSLFFEKIICVFSLFVCLTPTKSGCAISNYPETKIVLGDEKSPLSDAKHAKLFESICKKMLCYVDRVGGMRDIELLDGNDRANQCHINALLVVFVFQKPELFEPGEVQRFLVLNLLRFLPHNTPSGKIRDVLAKKFGNTFDDNEYAAFANIHKSQGALGRLNPILCRQLALVRYRLFSRLLSFLGTYSADTEICFKYISDQCFMTKDGIPTLPKIIGVDLFLQCVTKLQNQNSVFVPFIFTNLQGDILAYAFKILENFFPGNQTYASGPAINVMITTKQGFDPCSPMQVIQSAAFLFNRDMQQESFDLSYSYLARQGITDPETYKQNMEQLLGLHGINILHMSPRMI